MKRRRIFIRKNKKKRFAIAVLTAIVFILACIFLLLKGCSSAVEVRDKKPLTLAISKTPLKSSSEGLKIR